MDGTPTKLSRRRTIVQRGNGHHGGVGNGNAFGFGHGNNGIPGAGAIPGFVNSALAAVNHNIFPTLTGPLAEVTSLFGPHGGNSGGNDNSHDTPSPPSGNSQNSGPPSSGDNHPGEPPPPPPPSSTIGSGGNDVVSVTSPQSSDSSPSSTTSSSPSSNNVGQASPSSDAASTLVVPGPNSSTPHPSAGANEPPPSEGGPSATSTASVRSTNSHQISTASGVSVGLLLAIIIAIIVVFVLRRRSRKRRSLSVHNSALLAAGPYESDGATFGTGTRSARSSFGTSTDHGLGRTSPLPGFEFIDFPSATSLEMPPMAEVRQGGITHAEVPTSMLFNHSTDSHRTSLLSTAGHADVAPAPPRSPSTRVPLRINTDCGPSMFVSPFTPSEYYAFPTPPLRPSEAGPWTTPGLEPPAAALLAGEPQVAVIDHTASDAENGDSSVGHETVSDPFSDHSAHVVMRHFKGQEMQARRPFEPTLEDELKVEPGDSMKILRTYDDGWVSVEKGETTGLVPLDCFVSSDTGHVMAGSRVSSSCGALGTYG